MNECVGIFRCPDCKDIVNAKIVYMPEDSRYHKMFPFRCKNCKSVHFGVPIRFKSKIEEATNE